MRKVIEVTIEDDRPIRRDNRRLDEQGRPIGPEPDGVGEKMGDVSRDLGKVFQITEMPATRAEKWAIRALMAAGKSGMQIPQGAMASGMQGIAIMGINAIMSMSFAEAEPLLDEMMSCVAIKPDPRNPNTVRPLIEDDIEEVRTRIYLRRRVLDLHVGFSTAAAQ